MSDIEGVIARVKDSGWNNEATISLSDRDALLAHIDAMRVERDSLRENGSFVMRDDAETIIALRAEVAQMRAANAKIEAESESRRKRLWELDREMSALRAEVLEWKKDAEAAWTLVTKRESERDRLGNEHARASEDADNLRSAAEFWL